MIMTCSDIEPARRRILRCCDLQNAFGADADFSIRTMPDDIWRPFHRALCDDGIDAIVALKIVAAHPRCCAGILEFLGREDVGDVADAADEMTALYPISPDVKMGVKVMMAWVAARAER